MRGTGDAKTFSNISATPAQFSLSGGLYVLAGVATWSAGNIEIQSVGPDGSTLLSQSTAMKLTANGQSAPTYLPPGLYQLTVTTATAIYASIVRVPFD